jgi:hypothetical protein
MQLLKQLGYDAPAKKTEEQQQPEQAPAAAPAPIPQPKAAPRFDDLPDEGFFDTLASEPAETPATSSAEQVAARDARQSRASGDERKARVEIAGRWCTARTGANHESYHGGLDARTQRRQRMT